MLKRFIKIGLLLFLFILGWLAAGILHLMKDESNLKVSRLTRVDFENIAKADVPAATAGCAGTGGSTSGTGTGCGSTGCAVSVSI